MPRREHPGIGRRVPKLVTSLILIAIGVTLVFRDYTSGPIGNILDSLRDYDATRPLSVALWPHYRELFAEPSHGIEWIHIVGMLLIALGVVLILWRSQRPPERDPE
jgi:uncharacterized membrane protein